ncbi:MAG TPA: TetR/AcrR family transcriptional regulator [Nocardioides sp.]|nr:TetR/AcrR family transcriptional regulator [Nocardioides sp.]
MATRKYEQRLRADAAERTRRRVLDTVAERLRKAPTEPLSLDQVAQQAGVARSTIYVVFGSRAGLLDAFAEDLWARTGLAELTAAVAAPDAREHLRGGIRAASRMLAADIEIYRVLHAMARLDPDSVGGAVDKMDEERRGGMRYLAKRLKEDGVLRDDVTEAQAADLLWMLTSFEAFDQLHTDRGMSVDGAAEVLATTAERTLCR